MAHYRNTPARGKSVRRSEESLVSERYVGRNIGAVRAAAALLVIFAMGGCEGETAGQPPDCGNDLVDATEVCDGGKLERFFD